MTSARLIACVVVSLALGVTAAGAAPAGTLTAEEVTQLLAQRFGVEILRVTPIEGDGKDRYAVAAMNPGGDFDAAFKVTILIVDAETGNLVEQFRTEKPDYEWKATLRPPIPDDGVVAIRRETFGDR